MMPKRRDVTSLAESLTKLKPFPATVGAVRKLAADPETSVGEVACVVELDVGVATDLLRIANAPTSALAQKCTSVRHAASLLGLRRVCQLVESAAALAFVEKSAGAFPELANRVLAVAGVARMLAHITGVPPDDVFTAALLHDVGVLLLVQSEDPFYDGLMDSGVMGAEPSVEDEVALMGFDHAALGAAVVKNWNLPAPLPQVVALHHDWEGALKVGGAVSAMVALLRVAEQLVPALRANAAPTLDDLAVVIASDPAFGHLGLTREELFRSWEGLRNAEDKASLVGEAPPLHVQAAPEIPPRRRAPEGEVAPKASASPPWVVLGAVAAAVAVGAVVVVLAT
jgi:HD-like signal output (HDOD) protein